MKFGRVEHPEIIDLTLPQDHPGTKRVLSNFKATNHPEVYVGCAKWNRQDLKGFYPRGTKDELVLVIIGDMQTQDNISFCF